MNKGRQNHAQTKKSCKRRSEIQQLQNKKEVSKENAMQIQVSPKQPQLGLEEPLELIDDVFAMLDQISRILNEEGVRGINGSVMEELQALLLRVKKELSLQQAHNLEYCNRLSYIIDVCQRKCQKGKNIGQLCKIAEAEIQRVEHLYQQYFEDFTFLEEIRNTYLAHNPSV